MTRRSSAFRKLARQLFLVPFAIVIWSVQSAGAFDIAIGDSKGPSYRLGIGISSLVKVKLLPKAGIDLNPIITANERKSLEALSSGSVDFALVSVDGNQLAATDNIKALATLGKTGSGAKTLLTRRDVDDTSVQSILEAIFANVAFLTAIDPELTDLDPDSAVMGLNLPLHIGAKRFYATWWASSESPADTVGTVAVATETTAVVGNDRDDALSSPAISDMASGARNYVLYFGFDDASLNDAAQATLREAADFAGSLNAPAIIVAAYTDSIGDADYNYLLAERRAGSVMAGLDSLGVRYSRIDLSLFGERSPWAVTLDEVSEAGNRRVELFIEEPVAEVQPLPISAASTLPVPVPAGSLESTETDVTPGTTPKPAGGPEHRLLPTAKTRQLM